MIEADPSLSSKSAVLQSFYTTNKTQNYGKLSAIEEELTKGNYSYATTLSNSLNSHNPIESNYILFYGLYNKYYTSSYTNNDNLNLFALASECPFTDGGIVYQARALYDFINQTVELFEDNCPVEEDKNARLLKNESRQESGSVWNASIFPNPASNELFVTSNKEKDELTITIKDVNGKIVAEYNVKINGYGISLTLNLNDGIYFVTLSNLNNEKITKKLVVTK